MTDLSPSHTHSHTEPDKGAHLYKVRFVSVALILVDYVSWRKPVNRGIKDGHNHPAGKPFLLPQAVQVTVAYLSGQECANIAELKRQAGTSEAKSTAE